MKGITPEVLNNTDLTQPSMVTAQYQSISQSVRASLQDYFLNLGEEPPSNLYNMVLAQVEKPLIETVLQHTGYNQSKTARILKISRGTLRKKMAEYELFDN